MVNSDEKNDLKKMINDNLSKNVELYNKYTMLLASIFVSALTAIGKYNNSFSCWSKVSIFLFSISLFATLLELFLLILQDCIFLETRNYNFCKKISTDACTVAADILAVIALVGFLFGLITINIFVFTL